MSARAEILEVVLTLLVLAVFAFFVFRSILRESTGDKHASLFRAIWEARPTVQRIRNRWACIRTGHQYTEGSRWDVGGACWGCHRCRASWYVEEVREVR